MHIYKTKWFVRYAKRERINDKILYEAIERAERGLIDADLGGFVIKQRVGREGQGRSKGYRVLIAYQAKTMAIFIYGFAKSDLDNLDDNELQSLREISRAWLNANNKKIKHSLENGSLQEIIYEKKI